MTPRKFLPYFTLCDPDANAGVTLRDLLSHRTGLKDDLPAGWFERYRTHEGLIRAALRSAPAARFRELGPLGMRTSNLSIIAMQQSGDFSYGYTKEAGPRKLPMDTLAFLQGIAAAGAINSNAEEMGQWLRLMLGAGVLGGRRLVSEKGYQEMLSPAVRTSAGHYGLGWFIEEWHGHRLYSHPGGVPGFGARCEFLPDQGLGWVVLTNVDEQDLPKAIREIVFVNLLAWR